MELKIEEWELKSIGDKMVIQFMFFFVLILIILHIATMIDSIISKDKNYIAWKGLRYTLQIWK
jgi:hypothetical protein